MKFKYLEDYIFMSGSLKKKKKEEKKSEVTFYDKLSLFPR